MSAHDQKIQRLRQSIKDVMEKSLALDREADKLRNALKPLLQEIPNRTIVHLINWTGSVRIKAIVEGAEISESGSNLRYRVRPLQLDGKTPNHRYRPQFVTHERLEVIKKEPQ